MWLLHNGVPVRTALDRLRPATSAEALAFQFLNDARWYEAGYPEDLQAYVHDGNLHDHQMPMHRQPKQSPAKTMTSACPTHRTDRMMNPKKSKGHRPMRSGDGGLQVSDQTMTI